MLLVTSALALATAGCDILNKLKGGGDAGVDGEAAAAVADGGATAPVAAGDAGAATPTTTTTAAPTGTVHRVVGDAGVHADAGAATLDGGGPAPAPTPTLKLPPGLFDGGLKGFDAGGLKLPKF